MTADQPDRAPDHDLRKEMAVIIALSLPLVVNNLSRIVMGFVDFFFVSKLGTEAQAAMGPATVLLFCFIGFGAGIMSCVNTFASQAYGRGKPRESAAYLWQGLFWSGIFGAAALAFLPLVAPTFALFGHAPGVQRFEVTYTSIGLLSLGPSMAAAALSSFFNGIHRPMVTMVSSIVANLFNIGADYVLIFGTFGFPALGVAGAAWATVAATTLQTVFLLGVTFVPQFAHRFGTLQTMRWNTARAFNLIRLGLPAGLQITLEVAGWTIFINLLIGRFGTVELAATNVALKFLELGWVPAGGFGIAIAAMVGKAIGEQDLETARRRTRLGRNFVLAYMGAVALIFLLLGRPLIGLLSEDPAIIDLGVRILICAAIFLVFDGLGISYVSALRGAGDVIVPAVIFVVACWGIVIGGGFWVIHALPQLGSLGPWITATIYIILIGLLMAHRWRAGTWQKIDIFRETTSDRARAAERTTPTIAPVKGAAETTADGRIAGERIVTE